jgi:hypothetical protein
MSASRAASIVSPTTLAGARRNSLRRRDSLDDRDICRLVALSRGTWRAAFDVRDTPTRTMSPHATLLLRARRRTSANSIAAMRLSTPS